MNKKMNKQNVDGVLKLLGLQIEDLQDKYVVIKYMNNLTNDARESFKVFTEKLKEFGASNVILVPIDLDFQTYSEKQLNEIGLTRIKNLNLKTKKELKKKTGKK